jgi:hypothetical protein
MNPESSPPNSQIARSTTGEAVRTGGAGWSLGLVFLLFGAAAAGLARLIPYTELGNNRDPGPRAFPTYLGLLLILGGVWELAAWWRNRRAALPIPKTPPPGLPSSDSANTSDRDRDAVVLVGAVTLYIPAIVWLGFSLGTLLFTTVVLRRFGARWTVVLGTGIGLVLLVQLLFVQLFRVQLPIGSLGLPF